MFRMNKHGIIRYIKHILLNWTLDICSITSKATSGVDIVLQKLCCAKSVLTASELSRMGRGTPEEGHVELQSKCKSKIINIWRYI